MLPPGLYEATFEAKGAETTNADLVVGQWVMRCEARTLDDIRAMGGNSPEDERRFAAAKRVSEINLAAYQKFVQPWIKGMVTPQMAEIDAQSASAAAAVRGLQQPESLDDRGEVGCGEGRGESQAGLEGQSVPGVPGAGLQADRSCAG